MLLPSFSLTELHVITQIVRKWVNKQAYSTKVVDWSGAYGQKSMTLTTLSTELEMEMNLLFQMLSLGWGKKWNTGRGHAKQNRVHTALQCLWDLFFT